MEKRAEVVAKRQSAKGLAGEDAEPAAEEGAAKWASGDQNQRPGKKGAWRPSPFAGVSSAFSLGWIIDDDAGLRTRARVLHVQRLR